ncbi:MAG: PqqD family protein [Lachnospiraceae bacterium]|jgi:hypothetical protein|nr:PqqD family protein [Lachnospiraceae bacterium]
MNNRIGNTSNYRITEAAGRYFLYDISERGPKHKRPLPLNRTGYDIAQLWLEDNTEEAIIKKLSSQYDMNPSEIGKDVKAFFADLHLLGY